MTSTGRLLKEISQLKKDFLNSSIEPKLKVVDEDGNLKNFKIRFRGPEQSVYSAGIFQVDVKIPSFFKKDDYPFSPPVMKFETLIYHPNISSQTGAICLDILSKKWSPIMSLKTTMISLIAMLSAPEPTDPQDAEVASIMVKNVEEFENTARYWSEVYAPPLPDDSVFFN